LGKAPAAETASLRSSIPRLQIFLGQIVYVRKLQGSWNPEKGVK
jgi:hypothetical protein